MVVEYPTKVGRGPRAHVILPSKKKYIYISIYKPTIFVFGLFNQIFFRTSCILFFLCVCHYIDKSDGSTSPPIYCATHCPLPRGAVMDIPFFFDVLQLCVAITSLCLLLHAAPTPTALSVLGLGDELAAPSRPFLDCELGLIEGTRCD